MLKQIVIIIIVIEVLFDFLEMIFPMKNMKTAVLSFSKLCELLLLSKIILSYFDF